MEPTVLITSEQIDERVAEMGREIDRALPSGEIVVIGVLRGAFVFMADLVRAIPREMTCEFMTVRSYGDSTETSGIVEVVQDLAKPIDGKHVLIIEDIVDTGLTLKFLVDTLKLRNPASLHVAVALSKPDRRRVRIEADFTGFEVPDEFIVGYGLDAAQKYRNLPYFATLPSEHGTRDAKPLDENAEVNEMIRELEAKRQRLIAAGGHEEMISELDEQLRTLALAERITR